MKCWFVVFHVDRPGGPNEQSGGWWARQFAQLDNTWHHARMLRGSLEKLTGDFKLVLLTDATTKVPDNIFSEIVRNDIDAMALMYERTRIQLEYMEATDPVAASSLLFLDTDMLILHDWVFKLNDQHALALTIRHNEGTLVNGGFILINLARKSEALDIWKEVLHTYKTKFSNQLAWWGDQLAWDEILHRFSEDSRHPIVTLQCSTHNYSPSYKEALMDLVHLDPTIGLLHFKGERKRLMAAFYARYVRRIGGDHAAGFHPWMSLGSTFSYYLRHAFLNKFKRSFKKIFS